MNKPSQARPIWGEFINKISEIRQPLKIKKIALLGTLPPLRGLSSYCLEIASALAKMVNVEFISFKKIYPGFLYPGGDLKDDHTLHLIIIF